jgi:hypothetical protein
VANGHAVSTPQEFIVDDALVIAPPAPLALQRAPEEILREAAIAAKALRDLVESKPKKVVLNGKTFLQFEDWLTVARFLRCHCSRAVDDLRRARPRAGL